MVNNDKIILPQCWFLIIGAVRTPSETTYCQGFFMQPNEIRAALILKGITGVSIARSLGVPQQNVAPLFA
jgi:hypothetical protein